MATRTWLWTKKRQGGRSLMKMSLGTEKNIFVCIFVRQIWFQLSYPVLMFVYFWAWSTAWLKFWLLDFLVHSHPLIKDLLLLHLLYVLQLALTGYTSTSLYRQLEGTNWVCTQFLFFTISYLNSNLVCHCWQVNNLIMTEFLLFRPLFLMPCILNTATAIYNANAAMSFHTIFVVILIWFLLGYPLVI